MTGDELPRWVGDPAAFRREHWRRRPAVLHPAHPPAAPMTLADVDAALDSGLLRTPYLELARAGATVPETAYTTSRTVAGEPVHGIADPAALLAQLTRGATLVLRNTEHWHRPTRALTERLQAELGRQVEAFYFVTPPGAQGLDVHRDDADVLLLQIAGRKRWRVHGGPPDGSWSPGEVAEPGPVLLEDTLRENEVLYIPRGFAHAAVGDQGLSAHLSLTVREVGSQQLYRALQGILLGEQRLPARPTDDAALLASGEAMIERFRHGLATVTAAALLDTARAAQRAAPAPAATGHLTALAEQLATSGEQPR
ncbi:JmjC domain-containing protein [Kitasatospora sp. NPDC092948]|uniref:JmjC domain-containing protein n=1 Tax=Kitasatospora sp. NPDC092948 TaxID=3364088 RepID=UPI0037F307B2